MRALKRIIINSIHQETRVAVLEHGELVELFIERSMDNRIVGNIYKGRVANVLPGMQAAFVDVGLEKNVFLYIDDCLPPHNEERGGESRKPGISEILKEGQEIIVQVAKEPQGNKGARVTTHITLPGRYLVYVPEREETGVSRRIESSEERERLLEMTRTLRQPGEGIIIRTAGEFASEKEISQELGRLRHDWAQTLENKKQAPVPSLIYRDLDLVPRIVRDLFCDDTIECVIDNRKEYNNILRTLGPFIPGLKDKLKLYTERVGIFHASHVENEMEKVLRRRVWLKSGGYIVIDQTEALTSIDVNTGKFTGNTSLEETVLKTNMEAAREIVRQLRLRDIGGIIIIDFIDMEQDPNKEKVLSLLKEELKKDRTRSHVLGLTRLGLVEMTRKKVRKSLHDQILITCPCCDGKGKVQAADYVASKVERELFEYAGSDIEAVLVEVHPRVGAALIGNNGENLQQLEEKVGFKIYIKGNDSFSSQAHEFSFIGSEEEVRRRALPVREGEVLSLTVEEKYDKNQSHGIARLQGYVIYIDKAGDKVGERVLVKVEKVQRTSAAAVLVPSELLT